MTEGQLLPNLRERCVEEYHKVWPQFVEKINSAFVQENDIFKLNKVLERDYLFCTPNIPGNFENLFSTFKGIAWLNCRYFTRNKPLKTGALEVDLGCLRNKGCPDAYIAKLETKRYSLNTARSYTAIFKEFATFYHNKRLIEINELDIKNYLRMMVKRGISLAYQTRSLTLLNFTTSRCLICQIGFMKLSAR